MTDYVPLLEPLHRGLWTSGTRILSAYRFAKAGDLRLAAGGSGFVAPDVAAVFDATLDREKTSMATLVATLRGIDAEATSRFGAELGVPAGTSIFEPIYRQYLELEAAPLVTERPAQIWSSMPLEMYLAARFDTLSSEDQAALTALGYVNAFNEVKAGRSIITPDEAKIARAVEARAALAGLPPFPVISKNPAAAAPVVINLGSRTVYIVLGIAVAVAAVSVAAVYVLPAYFESKKFDAGAANIAAFNDQLFAYNGPTAEANRRIVEACVRRAEAEGTPLEVCAGMSKELLPFLQPEDPGPALADLADATRNRCRFGDCLLWSGIGLTIGVVAGAVAAKRLGLGGEG